MNYRIQHTTTYRYADSAEACHNVVRLQPRNLPYQRSAETVLRIEPAPSTHHSYVDYFGNRVHSFAVYEPHFQLAIAADTQVTLDKSALLSPDRMAASRPCAEVREQLRTNRSEPLVAALEFVFASPYVRLSAPIREFATKFFPPQVEVLRGAFELTQAIYRDFKYDPRATTVDTSVETVLEKRHGVCQDFAHLQIACLRSQGLACRYVSGYLLTDPQPGKPRLVGADASHAWVSVFCPKQGWVDLDPTNGCFTSERHITLGWGRDFHDVSPVKGVVLGGGESSLLVSVDVAPE